MNLEIILDRLIKKSFPELMNVDIKIEWKNLKDALMEQGRLQFEGFYIEVDKSLKQINEPIIIGGLAHELCHILAEIQMNIRLVAKDKIAYFLSKRYKTLDERNTDLQVIIRGYASELLEFMKHAESKGFDYYQEDGLSIREIEAILSSKI